MPIHQTAINEERVMREYDARDERWNRTRLGYKEARS
jgi:hypothetical protein